MAAADCTLVKGVQFWYSTNSGSTYTQLIDMVDLGSPGTPTTEQIEKTPLDPTTNQKEYTGGMEDPGEHSFMQLWSGDREVVLQALKNVNTTMWRIYYPDRTILAKRSKDDYTGTLIELSKEKMDGASKRLVLVGKIKVSGAVTFTNRT